MADRPHPAKPLLSFRECEVLQSLADEFSPDETADRLFVSTSTIKAHICTIYRKLSVHCRADAIAKARQLSLID